MVIDVLIIFSTGEKKNLNLILLPKNKNKFKIPIDNKDENILSLIINSKDKSYSRQIIPNDLIKDFEENSVDSKILKILNFIENNFLAKFVYIRDLFFCLCNNDIENLTAEIFVKIISVVIEQEKNYFIKNEFLKMYVFTLINFVKYYDVKRKFEVCYYFTRKINAEIPYKDQAFDLLYREFNTTPELRKNIINYLIDLLFHYYNTLTIDSVLRQRDDIKNFITFIQDEVNNATGKLERFDPLEFFRHIDYLDIVKIKN